MGYASPGEMSGNNQFIEYLAQQKISLTQAINQSNTTVVPSDQAQYEKLSAENSALLALNQANSASLAGFLLNQKTIQADYSEKLKQLQYANREDLSPVNSQETIDKINTLTTIHKKITSLIEDNIQLTNHYQDILLEKSRELRLWHAQQRVNQQVAQSRVAQEKLIESLNKFYAKNIDLQQEIKTQNTFSMQYLSEAKLLLNNQWIRFTQYQITELTLQRKLIKADFLLLASPDIRTLQTITQTYQYAINQLESTEQALQRIVNLLKNESRFIQDETL